MLRLDLTGQKFGRLLAIERDQSKLGSYWLCRCDCGNEKAIIQSSLRNGKTQSCGCIHKEQLAALGRSKAADLAGQKFNKLTAIKQDGRSSDGRPLWLCECECGGSALATATQIINGKVKSCGCIRGHHGNHKKTHGLSKSKAFGSWQKMRDRCFNSNNDAFHYYGGRGITVCSRYKASFESFFADMGERESDFSVERIDNNGHYSCGKCEECKSKDWAFNTKWATSKEQCNNRRDCRILEFDGERLNVTQWAEKLGINRSSISARLSYGWSTERVLTEKIDTKKRKN